MKFLLIFVFILVSLHHNATSLVIVKRDDSILSALVKQSSPIEQCEQQAANDQFEILYDNTQKQLYLILNKKSIDPSHNTTIYDIIVQCKNIKATIPKRMHLTVSLNKDTKNLLNLNLNNKQWEIKNRIETPERSTYTIELVDSSLKSIENPFDQPQQQLTFVEQYLLKQDKLNNTIWIYEELKIDTTIAYLSVPSSMNANIRVILTNRGTVEFLSDAMTFELVKLLSEDNGNIYAIKIHKRIDREQVDFYDLTINLSGGANGTVNDEIKLRICLIDINDNRPLFLDPTPYTADLHENRLYTNFIQIHALDYDIGQNGQIVYELLNGTDLFYINKFNGYLNLNVKLDREQCDVYVLSVRVCDLATVRLCNQTFVRVRVLDENDNAPKFNHTGVYSFKLRVFKPTSTLIGNVKAMDLDLNPKSDYKLQPSTSLFYINPINGDLYSKQILNEAKVYTFSICVNDAERSDLPIDIITVQIAVTPITEQDPFIEHSFGNETFLTLNLSMFQKPTQNQATELTNLNSNTNTSTVVSYDLVFIKRVSMRFISHLLNQTHLNEKYHKNNLTQMFTISSNGILRLTTQLSSLNTGLYNFSIRANMPNQVSTPMNVKLFVFSANSTNFSSIFDLNSLVEQWYDENLRAFWVSDYENKYKNGLYSTDIDYYENLTRLSDDLMAKNYLILNQFGSGVDGVLSFASMLLFNNNFVIIFICVFLFIAIILVSIITYKHYKATMINDSDKKKKYGKDLNGKKGNSEDFYEQKSNTDDSGHHIISTATTITSSGGSGSITGSVSSHSSNNKLLYSTTSIKTNINEGNKCSKAITALEDFDDIDGVSDGKNDNIVEINEIKTAKMSGDGKHIKFEDDFGYYGSSDYSDSNSVGNNRRMSTSKYNTIIETEKLSNETSNSSVSPITTVSASSPTFSSEPTISTATTSTYSDTNSNNMNVKLYFERFERMYNSRGFIPDEFLQKQLNNPNNRNSIAAYSYV